jgi:hypothetical protein
MPPIKKGFQLIAAPIMNFCTKISGTAIQSMETFGRS